MYFIVETSTTICCVASLLACSTHQSQEKWVIYDLWLCKGYRVFMDGVHTLYMYILKIAWLITQVNKCKIITIYGNKGYITWYLYKLTMWPALSWRDSSFGRALHQYCRGQVFKSHSSLNFSLGFTFTTA